MKMEQTKQPKVAVKGLSKFNTGGSQPQADNPGWSKTDNLGEDRPTILATPDTYAPHI